MVVNAGKTKGVYIKMEKEAVKEKCSALLDGELAISDINQIFDDKKNKDLVDVIDIYLQIGDVLREKEEFLNPSTNLLTKIRQCLESEICISIELDNVDFKEPKSVSIEM